MTKYGTNSFSMYYRSGEVNLNMEANYNYKENRDLHDLRGTVKHRLQLHSENQEVSDYPPSRAPHSLNPLFQGKT